MDTVLGIFLIGLVIGVHEFGHFIAAKRQGAYIKTFSIGFGPSLKLFTWDGTQFAIGLIPLGGYVMIEDLDQMTIKQQVKVTIAGPIANVLFASICLMVAAVPAVQHWYQIPVVVILAILLSFLGAVALVPLTIASLLGFMGGVSEAAGIIGITETLATSANISLYDLAVTLAVVNLSIASFNLLPIPVLDGGRLLDLLLKRITSKVGRVAINIFKIAGVLLILNALAHACTNDFASLFK